MRKWLVAPGILLVLVLVLVGLAVANLGRFVNENREWIGNQARSTVGRGIDFGEVGISLWNGLAIRVDGFEIEDDPAFSKSAFVRAEAIEVKVAFLPALRGNIQVDRVVLRAPTITVIQTDTGLNIDSLGGEADAEPSAPAPPDSEGAAALPAFVIAFVDISDGTLRYVDRSVSPASETRIEQLDFRASDIRSEGPIEFELRAAVLEAAQQNVRITGRVTDLSNPSLDLVLTSSALDLTPEPGGASANLLKDLELKASVALADAGPKVRASVRSPEGLLVGTPYRELAIDFGLHDRVATIERLSVSSLGGLFEIAGRYDMRVPEAPSFDVKAGVSGLSIEEVVRHQAPSLPPTLAGTVGLDLTLQGKGSDWDSIKRTLQGKGSVEMADGVLKDVNLVETALSAASGVPGMSNLLPPELRTQYPELFGIGDTVFDRMQASLRIDDGWVSFREMRLAAEDYEVRGRGRVSLGGEVEVGTTLALSRPLSDDLVTRASAMQYLRASDGRVELPVRLGGVAPRIQVAPDIDSIAKAASRQVAGKLLNEALSNIGDGETGGGTDAADRNPQPEDLLKRAIGDLFGK